LERGKRLVEVFKQPQYHPMPVETQVVVLWAAQNGFFDDVPVEKVRDFQTKLVENLTTRKTDLMARLAKQKALDDALTAELKAVVIEFKQSYK